MTQQTMSAAPMAAAPIKYRDDGEVDWGNMWDTFCVLAQAGGPPHRDELLQAQPNADPKSEAYQSAVKEIVRGIYEVSGLLAAPAAPGWIAVACPSAGMALWVRDAILNENVEARAEGKNLLVPVGAHFSLKGEVKSVITVVAKTTHYWAEHVPPDLKNTLEFETRLTDLKQWLSHRFRRA